MSIELRLYTIPEVGQLLQVLPLISIADYFFRSFHLKINILILQIGYCDTRPLIGILNHSLGASFSNHSFESTPSKRKFQIILESLKRKMGN